MASVFENRGFECVGIQPYKFTPQGETVEKEGLLVWFLESAGQGGYGQQPFKLSYTTERFRLLLADLGVSSGNDMVGNFYEITFNRWGRPERLTLIGSR